MKKRQFRRRQEGGRRRPRGAHARLLDKRKKVAIVSEKCGVLHPHKDCPADCHKFKGHIGKHIGYVIRGVKDEKTGKVTVKDRVEVQWTDEDTKAWEEAQRKSQEAGAKVVPVRSTDGREWPADKILPAEE